MDLNDYAAAAHEKGFDPYADPQILHKVTKTGRGFEQVEFMDLYGVPCELKQSSICSFQYGDAGNSPGSSGIWLGHSVKVDSRCETTPMHLNRDQVRDLVTVLQRWLETGSFEMEGAKPLVMHRKQPQYQDFEFHLQDALGILDMETDDAIESSGSCEHESNFPRIQRILKEQFPQFDLEKTLDYFRLHGVQCDCGVWLVINSW